MSSPAAIFNKDVEISGNSDLIIKSGGKLGIGVTNPSTKLDVDGSGNFSGDLNVDGSLNIGSITDVETYVNDISTNLSNLSQNKIENGNSNVIVNSSGGSITFDTDGSQRMIIKDDGDVSFSGNLYGDGSNLTGTADDFTAGKAKDLYTSGISNAINAVPYINGSGDTILNSNSLKFDGNNIIVKDNNGSASIGLTINDSGGNANLAFNHVNIIPDRTGNAGRIECNVDGTSGTALMHFELKPDVSADVPINLDNLLTLKHDGTNKNVGIGTTNPSKKLDVNGDGNFSGDLNVDGTIIASDFSGNGASLTNINAGNINSGILALTRGGTGSTSSSEARTKLDLGTNDSVQFAKLGLGRSPIDDSTLTISGGQYIQGYNTNDPSTETQSGLERGIIKLNLMTPAYAASDVDPSGDFLQIRRDGSSGIWQGKAIMNISNVTDKTYLTKLGFKLQSHPNGKGIDGTSLNQQLYTIPCVMTGGNRVGIGGTTNPSVELDVSGDGNFTGDLDVDGSLNIGSITDMETYVNDISSNLSNLSQDKIENGNSNVTVETSNGPISFDTAGTEKMRILTNGNVGIGKPDPSLELDVSGSIKISGSRQQLLTNIIRASYPGDTFIENNHQHIYISTKEKVIINKKEGNDGNTMIIDCNNKRVGIGKVPSIEFDVSGDVSFSGNLDVGGTLTASDFSGNGSGLTNLSAAKISTGTLALARGGTGATSVSDARTKLRLGTTNSVEFARLGLGKASDSNFRLDTNGAMRVRANPINRAQANGPERGVLLLHSSAGLGSNTEGGNSNFLIEPSGNILTLSRDGGSSVSYPLGCILNLSRWEASGNNSRSRLAFRLNHAGGQGDNESDYNTAMVICSNNSVGIGVTNPSTEFDVSGDVSFSGNLNVEGQIKTDTITISGGDMNIKTNTSHHIIFSTNNTETLRIKRNGNVGIGTHNPSKKLEVDGDVSFSGNLDVGGTITGDLSGNAATAKQLQTARTIGGASFDGTSNITPNQIYVAAENSNSTRYLLFTGNTTTTGNGLVRKNSNITVNPSTGTLTATSFEGDGSQLTGISSFWTGSSDICYNGGDVGIGTTNPGKKLDVSGDARISQELTIGNKLLLEDTCNIVRKNGTSALIINHQSNKTIAFKQAGNERMRIHDDGNVGIGTDSPSTKLDVDGSGNFGGNLDVGSTLTAKELSIINENNKLTTSFGTRDTGNVLTSRFIELANSTRGYRIGGGFKSNIGGIFTLDSLNNGTYAERFRIDNNGNVGIGTTNPATKLDVKDGSIQVRNGTTDLHGEQLTFSYGGNNTHKHYIATCHHSSVANSSAMYFYCHAPESTSAGINNDIDDTTNTKFVMSLTGAGRVGIGKTDPSRELDVNGSGNFSSNLDVGGDLTVTGNFTVNGTTTTVDTDNLIVNDSLIELSRGTTGAPANDAGIVIERGNNHSNAFMGWDESEDKFKFGTGNFTGSSNGNLTITTGTIIANLQGNVTGNVTGSSGSCTGTAANATKLNTTSNGIVKTTSNNGTLLIGSLSSGDIPNLNASKIDSGTLDKAILDTGYLNLENNATSSLFTDIGNSKINVSGFIYTKAIINHGETGSEGTGVVFGTHNGYAGDNISLITNGSTRLYINSSGGVGIGTTNPSTKLHVNGTVKATLFQGNGSQLTGISSFWSGSSDICYNDGNVGIGTNNPGEKLQVNGTVKATNYIATSDRNLKENIVALEKESVLEKVSKLNGYQFNFKSDETKQTKSGLIAQEVEEFMPELISTNTDGNKSMDYNGMIPYLVECIKVQQTQIQSQQTQIQNQQKQINMLKAKIENM